MKRVILLIRGIALVSLAVMFWLSPQAVAGDTDKHPDLDEQEQYIACSDCHKNETPEVYKQWYDSNHGIAMVKCYQCHGTLETFRFTPTRDNCAVCHEEMMAKCPKDKDCWQCHAPHTFKKK